MRRLLLSASLSYLLFIVGVAAQSAQPRTVWDGAYTAEQADRGRALYAAQCAGCHGSSLQGGEGTALVGDAFWDKWREQSVADLLAYVSKNMPLHAPGTLSPSTYADIVAHVLTSNDLPAGAGELSAASATGIQIVAKEGAGELPASTLARVVGCLAPREGTGDWRVVKATRPERTSAPGAQAPTDVPLGTREFALKFVLTPLTSMVGHRVIVTGLLIGEGGKDGVNVSTVRSIAPICE